MVENRFVGLRSRGVYETPGGTVLHAARRAVESITMDRDVMHERDRLAPRFAELIYNGFWFAPEMEFLRAAIDASQRGVTGEARVRLFKGALQITGPPVAGVALFDAPVVVRRGGRLRPARRGRLHPAPGVAARAPERN